MQAEKSIDRTVLVNKVWPHKNILITAGTVKTSQKSPVVFDMYARLLTSARFLDTHSVTSYWGRSQYV